MRLGLEAMARYTVKSKSLLDKFKFLRLELNTFFSYFINKVYRGMLPSGQVVAIKRAQQGSMQGGHEFKTEIELLSRVHHKNLVGLVGFCFEQGEQMLVYEFMPNGTLRESLSGKLTFTPNSRYC